MFLLSIIYYMYIFDLFGCIYTTTGDARVCVFAKFDQFLSVRSHFDTKRPENFFLIQLSHPLPLDRILRSIMERKKRSILGSHRYFSKHRGIVN